MLFLIGEILLCLLIALILGFILGWILRGLIIKEKEARTGKTPRPKDLEKVEGIGPKIAEILVENGIYDLEDLSNTSVASLEKIIDSAGPKYNTADPSTWPEQAELGAKGDWEAMQKLKDELRGGRRK